MSDWKTMVRTIAPTIGAALGGPMAGAGVKFLADTLLKNPDATEKDVADYIIGANPDSLLELKRLDKEFEIKMAELKVDVFKLETLDRQDARSQHKATPIPAMLTFGLTALVAVLFMALFTMAPPEGSQEILFMMLGVAIREWAGSMAYWFGTTRGSSDKNKMLGVK